LKVTFLGTGTSQGIPVIGCECEVCTSKDPHDTRLRTAAMVTEGDANIIIDVGPDFRMQMLNNSVKDISAVLITHEHNDHIIGLDDIRPFYFKKNKDIAYFTTAEVEKELAFRFPYVFSGNNYPGAPKVEVTNFSHGVPIVVDNLEIMPIKVFHGKMEVTAFRIKNFLYITDASSIPESSLEMMKGIKYLVINALRKRKHHSHFNLEQAIKVIDQLKPEKAYLTHLSHYMGKSKSVSKILPKGVNLAYDGLVIDL
jgi:phosphoribosyl 1,2-cyclic phosphate phosphodiesterase